MTKDEAQRIYEFYCNPVATVNIADVELYCEAAHTLGFLSKTIKDGVPHYGRIPGVELYP